MGFLDKLKQVAGIGGVKLQLAVPTEIQKSTLTFAGTITVTSKSDQHIKDISVELHERRLKKSGGVDQILKEYSLGSVAAVQDMDIKAGETKTVNFTCPFSFNSYEASRKREEQLSTEGGRKFGAFLDQEKSIYIVTAAASVKGTALASISSATVQLVGNIAGSVGDVIEKA